MSDSDQSGSNECGQRRNPIVCSPSTFTFGVPAISHAFNPPNIGISKTDKGPQAPITEDVDAEGIITFSCKTFSSYRYRIFTRDGKLRIWLENRKSKLQWQTEALAEADFVPSDGVIPQATFTDYATCFHDCLKASCDTKDGEFQRDLTVQANNELVLTFALQLRVFTHMWIPKYTFILRPVEVKPLDILSSQLLDQDEVIQSLRNEVASLKEANKNVKKKAVFLKVELKVAAAQNQVLVWQKSFGDFGSGFQFDVKSNGKILFLLPGIYCVQVMVRHNTTSNTDTYELLKNDISIRKCIDSHPNGYSQSSTMMEILDIAKQDTISVRYLGNTNAAVGSYLTIFLLNY